MHASAVLSGISEFKAALGIELLAGRHGYAWNLDYTYPNPAAPSPADTAHPRRNADPGHFIMDEKSGLLLDSYLDGSSLFRRSTSAASSTTSPTNSHRTASR